MARQTTGAGGEVSGAHRVVIDARAAQRDGWLGELVASYARHLAPHVDAIVLDPHRATPRALVDVVGPTRSAQLSPCTIEDLVADPPALLHVLDVSGGPMPSRLRAAATFLVASVHDPRPFEGVPAPAAPLAVVRRADVLLAPTPHVAEAVTALRPLGPWEVVVVGAGPRQALRSAGPADVVYPADAAGPADAVDPADAVTPADAVVPEGSIVCPDGLERADGLAEVLSAYARLPARLRAAHALVVATDLPGELAERARHLDLAPGRLLLVPRDDGPSAAAGARLVVAPGHTRPVVGDALAARRAGAAVICADGPAAARVVNEPGQRFVPNDAVAASVALAVALEAEAPPSGPSPVASWDDVVARTLAVYERAAASPARRRRRPTIAFVSPLPPEASGVATYSRALVEALARRCYVTCFVPDDLADDRRPVGTTLAPSASLPAEVARGRFDEVVYALGNHPRHGVELALLRAVPGAVELHDVRLVGAYAGLHAPGDALADELQRLYPGRYEPHVLRSAELSMEPAVEAGVWMTTEVAALATTVLTHSRFASGVFEGDSGVDAVDIGPLAVPTLASTEEVPRAQQRIVSAGVVHASKQSALLIEAFAMVVRTHPHASLVLVGPVDTTYRRELCELATRRGVGSRVVLTGRVSSEAYDAHLRTATLAVQLRAHSNGESSAAVADCLARGLPTVVTREGASGELPPEVVASVAVDVEASVLATLLADLLDDPDRRRAMSEAAATYAAANTFDAAADRLLAALFGPGRC